MDWHKNISQAMQFASDRMKKNGLFETERLFCDLYCLEAGQAQTPHTHEGSDKIYFVVSGTGSFEIDEEAKQLGKNDIAIARSGRRHGVKNPGPDRLVLLVFMAPKPSH